MGKRVRFTLDGAPVEADAGETLWEVARGHGLDVPHLCLSEARGYRPDGNCRVCMVEIEGERTLAASCIRRPEPGMVVRTQSPRASRARAMVMELLVADQPARAEVPDQGAPIWRWADRMGVSDSRFPEGARPAPDSSHPAMRVRLDACIHCNLCVRACREVQVNDVIGMAQRGSESKIVFDFDDPMGDSTCVACGECVQACPTGALMEATRVDAHGADRRLALEETHSVCPYCGVGCQITYQVADGDIVAVRGRDGPANQSRLCVKGRFGFDYVSHPDRLLRPLVRRDDAPPKCADTEVDPRAPWTHFREASWDEALDRAAAGLTRIRDRAGPDALAGFGSAKGSNEEAYLVQKLVRQGFGTNNVDHCTRLCHASSVAALLEGIGSGAVTAPFTSVAEADVVVVIGANPTENHPVAATFFKQAAKRASLIVMDPRGQGLARHTKHMLRFRPGTDVALLNALLHVIIAEDLYDPQFVQARTEGLRSLGRAREGILAGGHGPDLRHRSRHLAGGGPRVCAGRTSHHLLGDGYLPARPRHRQRALPDRARPDHRAHRAARYGSAPAPRAEQRAGSLGRRAGTDGVSGLPAGGHRCDPPTLRAPVGAPAGPGARSYGRRDRECHPRRDDPRALRHGGKSGNVRPRHGACPSGARRA